MKALNKYLSLRANMLFQNRVVSSVVGSKIHFLHRDETPAIGVDVKSTVCRDGAGIKISPVKFEGGFFPRGYVICSLCVAAADINGLELSNDLISLMEELKGPIEISKDTICKSRI